MKKRNRILITLAITVPLCGLTLTALFPSEPSYHERRLSEWIGDLNAEAAETKSQAREAVREIGVKGMPMILGLLHAHDSPLKVKFIALANRQSLIKFKFNTAVQKQHLGLMACDTLGPVAQAAIPILSELFNGSPPAPDAAFAMARIGGPQAIASLTQSLTSTNKAVRLSDKFGLYLP